MNSIFKQKKIILIMIDFSDFYCPLCVESLKTFCDNLNSRGQENFPIGILVFKSPKKKNSKNYNKIIEKKLRGFIIGNGIQFPVLIDRNHVLSGLNLDDSDIILLDLSRKLIKKYTFPLTADQLNEIYACEEGELR